MIILDTNVLSEAMKPLSTVNVMRWLGAQEPRDTFTTAVAEAEILYGIERLPVGERRARLSAAAEILFVDRFAGRVLSFDEQAARSFAVIVAGRAARGRPIADLDAMIAAIARSRSARLATRNVADFEECGIDLVDPWSA